MTWKVVDEIRKADTNDIDVIALDDVLQRALPPAGATLPVTTHLPPDHRIVEPGSPG